MADVISVPLLDLKLQYQSIRAELDEAVRKVCESQMFILGPEVEAFEKEMAEYCGCKYALGVSSGTDAILLAMMAAGIGAGDEVITTGYSFFATAGSVARTGARPVFSDIDPVSFNLNPGEIERRITAKTKAILPVHLYGQCAEMGPILEIAKRRGLLVIEDAAQAIGSEYQGRRAGSIGDIGCFSFFPSKNLGGFGDGGLVTTNDERLYERLKMLRVHGGRKKYYHDEVGGNFRLDALQAAVLRVKLRYLDGWSERRKANAESYRRLFAARGILCSGAGCSQPKAGTICAPAELAERRHIYNQFVIRSAKRDALWETLRSRKIGAEVYYPVPLHLQTCFAYLGGKAGDLPESERAAAETLALPIFPELTALQLEAVADAVALGTK